MPDPLQQKFADKLLEAVTQIVSGHAQNQNAGLGSLSQAVSDTYNALKTAYLDALRTNVS